MKVLVITDLEHHGGATIACRLLIDGLAPHADIRHVWLSSPPSRTIEYPEKEGRGPTIRSFLTFRRCARALVQWAMLARAISRFRPDIINLHNIHGTAIPQSLLPALPRNIPIVWTLHDEWSFTGRCAYSMDCRKFQTGCDSTCPTPGQYPILPPSLIQRSWLQRKSFFSTHSLAAVCPSAWLAGKAETGFWESDQISMIPYGMNLEAFDIGDRQTARKELNIPADARVLLSMAVNAQDPRKGHDQLVDALERVTMPITLLVAGKAGLSISNSAVKVIHLGYLDSEASRANAYHASNALLHPATMDNLPLTVMEATACGIPTVAFAVGGVPEMIIDGETGLISPEMTGECYAATLDRLESQTWDRTRIRAFAENRYDNRKQTEQYLSLFERMITLQQDR